MSKATFDSSVLFTLQNEGGYTYDTADNGGPTNWGITQDDYSEYLGRHASIADVKAMPKAVATAIYRKKYWDPDFEKLDQSVATAIFDWCVLHGITSAIKQAQQVAKTLGAALTVDGDFGAESVKALNSLRPAYFVSAYAEVIKSWMRSYVAANPSQKVFLTGWLARADRIAHLS